MDNLLRINYESEQPTVSARDLYEKLNIKTAFKDWFPRMCEYGFDEGKDFCSKMSETSSKGGRPSKDADISIDMAKADLHDSAIAGRKTDPAVFH
jgi:anti-repressor protein